MIDRTEQGRLLLYLIALMYYKTKGSIQRGAMHIHNKSQHTALRVHVKKKSKEGRYIDAKSIKSVC